jgi:hypothetical protein
MPKEYTTKPVAASPYRVDSRVTVFQPKIPLSSDIHGGPHLITISGVRVNDDRWPSASWHNCDVIYVISI